MKLLCAFVTVMAAASGVQAFYTGPGPIYPSGPGNTFYHERAFPVARPVPVPVVENVPVVHPIHRTLVRNVPHPVPVIDPVPVPVPVPRIRPVPVIRPVPRIRHVPVESNHFHFKQLHVPLPY